MQVSRLVWAMVFALIALAGFQGYWMWQAWQMQSEIFDRQVKEALLETVERIEKAEVRYLARQREIAEAKRSLTRKRNRERAVEKQIQPPAKSMVVQRPSSQDWNLRDGTIPAWMATEQAFFRQIAEAEEVFWQSVGAQLPGMYLRETTLLDLEALVNDEMIRLTPPRDTSDHSKPRFVQRKADMVREVFTDLVDEKRTTAERVNRSMVDTVLASALKQRGILMRFEVGVRERESIVFASYPMQEDTLRWVSAYHVPLFSEGAQLFAHFPEKDSHIWKKIRALLASSLLLFGAFGVILYVAADTLWKQKTLSAEKSEFISNMTHEFKTPITTISLAVQALTDRTISWSSEVRDRYLGVILQENQRLRDQVDKVLQSATLEKGKIGISRQEIDIAEVFGEIQKGFALRLETIGGALVFVGEPIGKVWVDPIHFRNMVGNLIDNACKYSQGQLKIELGYQDQGKEVCIWVQDNGIGIPEDQVDRVFDQFYRVSTGNIHDVKGFGLGLFYVRKMMEAHQGRWILQSTVGEGTKVELYFQKPV